MGADGVVAVASVAIGLAGATFETLPLTSCEALTMLPSAVVALTLSLYVPFGAG